MPPNWEEHRQSMTSFARSNLPHRFKDDAEDVVQDTMFQTLRSEDGREKNRSFLMTATRNQARDLFRRENAVKRGGGRTVSLDNPDAYRSASPEPSEAAERAEESEQLHLAVTQLPEPVRAVIEARLAGETFEEIAEHLQIPPGTVKSRMHLAHEKLRRLMHV